MRDDIINLLAGRKNLTHVFITTFNIDFIFIESVLLRELRKCGHPSLTVLADADEIAATFASQGRWISRIGRRYRVVPIRMEPGFRFHPKVVMLAGPEHADLFIGSGNLTFGGMRQNDELWLRFQSDQDGNGPLASFRDFAEACLARTPHPAPVRMELREAFDPDQHAWARSLGSPSGVLAKVGSGPALLRQMVDAVGDLAVQRIVVGSPYFDETGEALAAIAAQWSGVPIEVIVQPGQSQLLAAAWARIREPKSLVTVATSRGEDAQAFIHAKFYAFIGASEAVLCVGSANCSRAALTLPGSAGNAEAIATMMLKTVDVDAILNSGLRVIGAPAKLRTELPPAPAPEPAPTVRILAAHHEHGELLVRYAAPEAAQTLELLIDGRLLKGHDVQVSDGVVKVRSAGIVNRVQLVAAIDGERHVSAEHWVDHEYFLSATSRQRQIAQAIGDHVAPGQWSFQGWTEVLRLLGDHLTYTPAGSAAHEQKQQEGKERPTSVAAPEFFTQDYRLPGHPHEANRLNEATRVLGLRGLLLDYFGVLNDEHTEQAVGEDDGDDDTVDKPQPAEAKQHAKPSVKAICDLTDAERRRGHRIAKQIVDICTSKKFAENRPATMMASDLAIVAVLLVSGHAERWLADADFLDLTYRVWSFLFFDDGTDENGHHPSAGALARRHDASPDPHQFEESIRSFRLAAALATWCFCCPQGIAHAEATRFEVATRLAVARLPWLWYLDGRDRVEQELFAIARRTGWLGPDVAGVWGQVVLRWDNLFAEGRAIALLEASLLQMELSDLKNRITDDEVPAGALLWQGPKLGFCALVQAARRRSQPGQSVAVLTLRSQKRDTRLSPLYLLPFRSLLQLAADAAPKRFTQAHLEALEAFATRIELMWASTP